MTAITTESGSPAVVNSWWTWHHWKVR